MDCKCCESSGGRRNASACVPTSRAKNAREMGHPDDLCPYTSKTNSGTARLKSRPFKTVVLFAAPSSQNHLSSGTSGEPVPNQSKSGSEPDARFSRQETPRRAARPDSSLRKKRSLGMTTGTPAFPLLAQRTREKWGTRMICAPTRAKPAADSSWLAGASGSE